MRLEAGRGERWGEGQDTFVLAEGEKRRGLEEDVEAGDLGELLLQVGDLSGEIALGRRRGVGVARMGGVGIRVGLGQHRRLRHRGRR